MGCNKKHAGGQWLHLLGKISLLNIYYSEYPGTDIMEKEEMLILSFMNSVSIRTKENLLDPMNCYPFANKELHRINDRRKIRKIHGLSNQTIECGVI